MPEIAFTLNPLRWSLGTSIVKHEGREYRWWMLGPICLCWA